jgi:23S rRNA maturation-related 3'-5' exoribonuclease YhaM
MGRKLLKAMKVEVDKIRYSEIQKLVKAVLMKCNDYNATGAASSSGKYHPPQDLGDGGLVRHTKAVARNVERMLQCMPQYDADENWSVPYAAAILHDYCKYTEMNQKNSNENHPVLMSDLIGETYMKDESSYAAGTMTLVSRIQNCVSSHMSRWNKCWHVNGLEMPTPASPEQMILPYADMIGSAKWFRAEFDSDNNIID